MANLQRLRQDVHSLDNMLEEIESFQTQTDSLIHNMQDIDVMLR